MRRLSLIALVSLLAATPAWAAREWYEFYDDAVNRHLPAGRYDEALKSLEAAVRLRPASGLDVRTYGVEFVNYLPYYQQGVCYLKRADSKKGDFNKAILMFNIEESKGAVKRDDDLYKALRSQRTEAENAERQRVARQAREEYERLFREGSELNRAKKFDEALALLVQAQFLAGSLDPAKQREVRDLMERIRADKRELADTEARAKRVDDALVDGRRLLEEGRPTEASVRFDEVLTIDPQSARALDGRREAQERIRASKNKRDLDAAFQEGKSLFESGRYDEAVRRLTDAAADPTNAEARIVLQKAQKLVEGLRQQRELQREIDRLLSEGERLLVAQSFPEAQVKFEGVLQLDPGHVRAKERRGLAERMTGEALFAQWLPNQEPTLSFYVRPPQEIEASSLSLVGFASDDRGLAGIQFRIGGRLVTEQPVTPVLDSEGADRNVRFEQKLPLEPGLNEISVTATDAMGLRKAETFRVTRRLRFYETRAFLPSVLAGAAGLVGLGFAFQQARRRRAVRSRFNPYIAGAPVMDDDMFFGRQRLLSRILNVLHHNSLMITGERRIGKTTFLYHLRKALEVDEGTEYRFFPVFTDLQGVPEESFFHAVMADVVEGLALPAATLGTLRFRTDNDAYDGRDFSHDLQRVVEELKTRTTRKVKLALLIDEVDVLNEYSERINQRLRSIFMKTFSEHLVAVMSGVGIRRTWKSEGSPWYNFFDEVEVSAFTREDAEALIRSPVEGVFRYEHEAAEAILRYSDLKPYVIQKFCIHAVSRILEQGRTTITAFDVEAVRDAVKLDSSVEAEPATPQAAGAVAP